MIDEFTLALLWAAWLSLSTMPLGFMLGSSCSPCCGPAACEVADGKPRTDPATEGVWAPSGTWVSGVTWTYSATPSTSDGGTWFFFGSASTSRVGGGATSAEQRDWYNICNWYSNKTTSPSSLSNLSTVLDKRATRLPPSDAIVHIYSPSISTSSGGPVTVKNAYFWNGGNDGGELTTTASAHDAVYGALFINSGNSGTINAGAEFVGRFALLQSARNDSVVNGGARFFSFNENTGVINDGAEFYESSKNSSGTVNDGATFNDNSVNDVGSVVNGGATFIGNDPSLRARNSGTVNDGAIFDTNSANDGGTVNDGAEFFDNALNSAPTTGLSTVNGGAVFNDTAKNQWQIPLFGSPRGGLVNGGATFNDSACTERTTGNFFATPCTRKFVAHPTDLPTCNGTANNGCVNSADACGCG